MFRSLGVPKLGQITEIWFLHVLLWCVLHLREGEMFLFSLPLSSFHIHLPINVDVFSYKYRCMRAEFERKTKGMFDPRLIQSALSVDSNVLTVDDQPACFLCCDCPWIGMTQLFFHVFGIRAVKAKFVWSVVIIDHVECCGFPSSLCRVERNSQVNVCLRAGRSVAFDFCFQFSDVFVCLIQLVAGFCRCVWNLISCF